MNPFNNNQTGYQPMPTNNAPNSSVPNWNMPQNAQQYNTVPNWNRPNFNIQPQIPGRQVINPQEIRPNEVPMDGTAAFFPMNDYSAIYVKAWGADGNIQTLRYIPETVESPQQGPTEFEQVMARLDAIEQSISSRFNKRNNQKKEVTPNEQ